MRLSLTSLAAALAVVPLTVVTPVLLASPSGGAVAASADKPATKPTSSFAKGVLTVRGTSRSQTMSVVRHGRKVTVRVGGVKVPLPRGYTNGKCKEIRVLGLAGDDRMRIDSSKGSLPDVVLVGGKGDDVLVGGQRDDVLDGGQGDDVLRPGDGGRDELRGGVGADSFVVDADSPGRATIVEPDADGPDHLSFAPSVVPVTIDLTSPAAQPVSSAYSVVLPSHGVEDVTGGSGADVLRGDEGPNRLVGGPGDDILAPRPMMSAGPDDGNVLVGDAGDDTFEWFVGCSSCGTTTIEDSAGSDTLSFVGSGSTITTRLDTTEWQTITSGVQLRLASVSAVDNVIGGSVDHITGNDLPNRLNGWYGDDTLTGKGGPDTFVVGGPFPGLGSWGDDTVTDFATGTDAVDLDPGLTVRTGLGSATVTIWNGTEDRGTLTATNGHLWTAQDFG